MTSQFQVSFGIHGAQRKLTRSWLKPSAMLSCLRCLTFYNWMCVLSAKIKDSIKFNHTSEKAKYHSTGIHPWIDRLFSLTPAVLLHHGWTTTDDAKTSCRGHDIGWYVRCLNFGRIVSKYDFQLPYTSSWSDMSKLGTSCGIYILYVQETSYLYTTTITTGFCWHSSETPILGCFVVPANSWAISGTANCCWRCPRLNHLASSGTLLHQTFLAIEQPQEASLVTVSQCGISIPNKTMSPWVNHNMIITCFILSTIHSAQSWKVTPYLLPYTFHSYRKKILAMHGLPQKWIHLFKQLPCLWDPLHFHAEVVWYNVAPTEHDDSYPSTIHPWYLV